MGTKIINIGDLKKEPLVTIVTEDGTKHSMITASVETFIENMTEIEKLGINASPVKELEVIVGIVARAFPTLSEKEIRSWPIDVIQQLSDTARGVNGEIATTDEDAAKEANSSGNARKAS